MLDYAIGGTGIRGLKSKTTEDVTLMAESEEKLKSLFDGG